MDILRSLLIGKATSDSKHSKNTSSMIQNRIPFIFRKDTHPIDANPCYLCFIGLVKDPKINVTTR